MLVASQPGFVGDHFPATWQFFGPEQSIPLNADHGFSIRRSGAQSDLNLIPDERQEDVVVSLDAWAIQLPTQRLKFLCITLANFQ